MPDRALKDGASRRVSQIASEFPRRARAGPFGRECHNGTQAASTRCQAGVGSRPLMNLPARLLPTIALFAALEMSAFGCKKDPPSHDHGAHAGAANAASDAPATVAPGGTASIRVDAQGYHPTRVRAAANSEITLSFVRTTDECCGQQLKIPSMNINRDLPLNQPVAVTVRVPASRELAFTCGMDMYRGAVVVQ